MISSTFYEKLDPSYRQKLIEIEKTVQRIKVTKSSQLSFPELRKVQDEISNFVYRYMMPKQLWDTILKDGVFFSLISNDPLKLSQYQFLVTNRDFKKLYNDKCGMKGICDVENSCYPHIDMDKCFENFEKERDSFVPKSVLRQFKRMKLQYDKIKVVEEDEEKWLEAILEVDDEEFVEHNIEFRLGQDLTNKNLWKKYLEYLKSSDQQKLLQVYSKYCRFFLDDTEMFEEYRTAAGKPKNRVPWRNAFDFEVFDTKCYRQGRKLVKRKYARKNPLLCHFNAENYSIQRFPFRSTLMNYIIKNANAFVLHDLFKSCKWFYFKNPVTTCYTFETGDYYLIHDQSIFVTESSSFSSFNNKLFISTKLCIELMPWFTGLISRIYRCTAKYISIYDQKFTEEELHILIGHGNVIDLHFCGVKKSNEEYFKLENVLEMVPKIKTLGIISVQCTSETSQKLCEMPFENKIYELRFHNIQNNLLEPKTFAKFVNKNVSSKSIVHMHFDSKIDADYKNNFETILKDAIDEYWNEENKPKFELSRR